MAKGDMGRQSRKDQESTPSKQNPDYRRGMTKVPGGQTDAGQTTGMRGQQG